MDELTEAIHPAPLVDRELCDGCGECIEVCPNRVLALERGRAFVAHAAACRYVGACEMVCRLGAIARVFQIVFAA